MKAFNYFSSLLLLLVMVPCMASDVYESEVKLGNKVTIMIRTKLNSIGKIWNIFAK